MTIAEAEEALRAGAEPNTMRCAALVLALLGALVLVGSSDQGREVW